LESVQNFRQYVQNSFRAHLYEGQTGFPGFDFTRNIFHDTFLTQTTNTSINSFFRQNEYPGTAMVVYTCIHEGTPWLINPILDAGRHGSAEKRLRTCSKFAAHRWLNACVWRWKSAVI
jgi:hypothetical protein